MAHFTKMKSMARTDEDHKKQEEKMRDLMDTSHDGLDYPPGCCICLTDAELEKLGIDDMPEAGDTCHMCVIARVTGVADGKMGKRIELQIESMALENEDEENEEMTDEDRADSRYGKDAA